MNLVDPTNRVAVIEHVKAIKRTTLLSLMSNRLLRRAANVSPPHVTSVKQEEQQQQQQKAVASSDKLKDLPELERASLQSIRRNSVNSPADSAFAATAAETEAERDKLYALVEMCVIRYALEMFHLGRSFEDAEYIW